MKNYRRHPIIEYVTAFALVFMMVIVPCAHYVCLIAQVSGRWISNLLTSGSVACAMCVVTSAAGRDLMPADGVDKALAAVAVAVLVCIGCSPFPTSALYGDGRLEGGVMLFCYMVYFLTGRNISGLKSEKIVLAGFVAVASAHCVYGLAQYFDLSEKVFDSYHTAISGVAGNPNFMGSLTVMALGITAGMALFSKGFVAKIIYGAMAVLAGITLLLTKSLSACVGAVAVAAVLAGALVYRVYLIKGKKTAALATVVCAVAGIIAIVCADMATGGMIKTEISALLTAVQTGQRDESVASGRLVIWQGCLQLAKENLLTGVGIGNLMDPFYEAFGLVNSQFVDRAHNELLNILVTMGLPAFTAYVALYAGIFCKGMKKIKANPHNPQAIALMAAFVGYMAQGMFNISVIDVAPYFWILAGLLAQKTTDM